MIIADGALAGWGVPMMPDTEDLEQVRQSLAAIQRERSVAQQSEVKNRWLRRMGYITRPAVYLGPVVILIIWLWPDTNMFSQPIANLSVEDLFFIGCSTLVLFLVGFPMALLSFNVDGDEIDWEVWGRFGLWPIATIVAVAVWLG
jgi:hypothetical protein